MPFRGVIDTFKNSIDPSRTHVKRFPNHILVFGGTQGLKFPRHISCRNIFLLKSSELTHPLSRKFVMPEDYPNWGEIRGYDNLVDFEIQAGCLSRAIILFLETEGSFAELGAFCMDEALRERLFVVIGRKYYEANDSFICLGPVTLVKNRHGDESICVVDEIKPGHEFEKAIEGILCAIETKLETSSGTSKFACSRKQDQFLLVADIIDFFNAITRVELIDILKFMGVIEVGQEEIKRMLWLLELFGMVHEKNIYGKVYFVSNRNEDHNYLAFSGIEGGKPFDRRAFKVNTISPAMKKDKNRRKACGDSEGV